MSLSKEKKARRLQAAKRARRNKILIIIACVVVLAGLTTAVVLGVDWDKASNEIAASDHQHGAGCAH